MKTLIIFLILTSGLAHAIDRDEALSQKYEAMILDGEDRDVIEDQMTEEGVTAEDLELTFEEQ